MQWRSTYLRLRPWAACIIIGLLAALSPASARADTDGKPPAIIQRWKTGGTLDLETFKDLLQHRDLVDFDSNSKVFVEVHEALRAMPLRQGVLEEALNACHVDSRRISRSLKILASLLANPMAKRFLKGTPLGRRMHDHLKEIALSRKITYVGLENASFMALEALERIDPKGVALIRPIPMADLKVTSSEYWLLFRNMSPSEWNHKLATLDFLRMTPEFKYVLAQRIKQELRKGTFSNNQALTLIDVYQRFGDKAAREVYLDGLRLGFPTQPIWSSVPNDFSRLSRAVEQLNPEDVAPLFSAIGGRVADPEPLLHEALFLTTRDIPNLEQPILDLWKKQLSLRPPSERLRATVKHMLFSPDIHRAKLGAQLIQTLGKGVLEKTVLQALHNAAFFGMPHAHVWVAQDPHWSPEGIAKLREHLAKTTVHETLGDALDFIRLLLIADNPPSKETLEAILAHSKKFSGGNADYLKMLDRIGPKIPNSLTEAFIRSRMGFLNFADDAWLFKAVEKTDEFNPFVEEWILKLAGHTVSDFSRAAREALAKREIWSDALVRGLLLHAQTPSLTDETLKLIRDHALTDDQKAWLAREIFERSVNQGKIPLTKTSRPILDDLIRKHQLQHETYKSDRFTPSFVDVDPKIRARAAQFPVPDSPEVLGDLLSALDLEPNSRIRKDLLARIQSVEADHIEDLKNPKIPEPDPKNKQQVEDFWARTRRLQPELVETLQEFWLKAFISGKPPEAAAVAILSLREYPNLEAAVANQLIPYLAQLTYPKTNETNMRAIELLARLKRPDDATLVAIADLIRSENPNVGREATEYIRKLKNPPHAVALSLAHAFASSQDERVVGLARELLESTRAIELEVIQETLMDRLLKERRPLARESLLRLIHAKTLSEARPEAIQELAQMYRTELAPKSREVLAGIVLDWAQIHPEAGVFLPEVRANLPADRVNAARAVMNSLRQTHPELCFPFELDLILP